MSSANALSLVQYKTFGKEITLFQKRHILDPSKLTQFADDNCIFGENSGKFSYMVENAEEKEGIARYEQISPFLIEFSKDLP